MSRMITGADTARDEGGVDRIEACARIARPPEEIFAIYRDVANWNAWDPDTRQASLHGPFAIGTTGDLVPERGRKVTMKIVAIQPDRGFSVEVRIPLFRMRFDHELTPMGAGTEVLHRVTFAGPLACLLAPSIGGPLRTGLPRTLQGLKRYAEEGIAIR
jgi:hypothetical protein